jgi:DnaA family protein
LSQLALPLQLQDHAVFESFLPTGNEALVAFLREIATVGDGPGGWIWGAASTGKTHLLQAVCERAGDQAQFLPLRQVAEAGCEILDGLAIRHFVCLDDIDIVAGDGDWEVELFKLSNAMTDAGNVLLCSASAVGCFKGSGIPPAGPGKPFFPIAVISPDAARRHGPNRGIEAESAAPGT